MEVCLYNGKKICAYDVTNRNFALNYQLKKEWKIAGGNGELICPECGMEVILKVNDPKIKIPHFSHKVSNEKCDSISNEVRESEEHKKGKMILYTYMKELYPEENIFLNFRFKNKRRADIYCEFKNGNKLVLEYQRTALDFTEWKDRQEDYNENNINTLWFIANQSENVKNKDKQIEVKFFEQIMLNEMNNIATYFDINKSEIVLAKNMYYQDKYDSTNTFDELFIKSYKLDNIIIASTGEIQCDFNEEYTRQQNHFEKKHDKLCEDMQQKKKEIEENQKQEAEKAKLESEKIFSFDNNIPKNNYCNIEKAYQNHIILAVKGNENRITYLVKYLINHASSQDFKCMTIIFNYMNISGFSNSENIYRRIMDESGISIDDINFNDNLDSLKCPYCGCKFVEEHTRQGRLIKCSNIYNCKFKFRV